MEDFTDFLNMGVPPGQPPEMGQRTLDTRPVGSQPKRGKGQKRKPTIPIPAGRVLPHNLEAEKSVLGAVLVQNEAIDRVREVGLQAADFYSDAHQKVFETACLLADRRDVVDLVTLSSALKDRGWFDAVGGMEALTNLFDEAFAVGNVQHYAHIIRDKSVIRRMIDACSSIIGEGLDGVENVETFLDDAESQVFDVAGTKVVNSIVELRKVLIENMSAIEELSMRKQDVVGLSTGFHEFDKVTTGLQGGQVMILAARPGMGKTSWFISALQHAASSEGDQAIVALFSLEMSKEEIGFRFLSGLSRIDSRKLKLGRLHENDWHRLAAAADTLSKSKIFIDDSGGVTVMDIRAKCRRLKAKEKKLDLIVVDYLQLMRGSKAARGGDGSREREISEISRNLKELAKELRVPIIALSQLNRGVEMRQDKRPTLSDLRESGAIEQDADMVCFIHRDDYYNKDSEERGIAELILAKNRAGETTTVRLAWLPQYTLFANLKEETHSPGPAISRPRPEKGDITL